MSEARDRDEAAPPAVPDQWVDVAGTRVRYTEHTGPQGGPTFVLVHGLGGALTNWDSLAPLLATYGRVLALDLGGFGLTKVDPKKASVAHNQKLLSGFLRALDLRQVVLVGNSMGGLLTAMEAAAEPDSVRAVVLVDPVLPQHPRQRPHPMVLAVFGLYLVPPIGRRLIDGRAKRLTPEELTKQTFALVVAHLSKVPRWLIDRHVELARDRMTDDTGTATPSFLAAARSVVLTGLRAPSYQRLLGGLTQPVLLLHGDKDKLVSVKAARAAAQRHPSWTYAEGHDLGHCPMFEDPEWVRDQIVGWLGAQGLLPDEAERARRAG